MCYKDINGVWHECDETPIGTATLGESDIPVQDTTLDHLVDEIIRERSETDIPVPDTADQAISDYRSEQSEQDVFATNWLETDK